ncbi:MAG: metallophosphoesterase family protein [Ignavibacteriales bacterium]|nr:metallophosphoesterase family protein [Ignavibacteriales bacterium]
MKLAILSDIHSNFEALTAALEIVKQSDVDEIVCLGDVVGYGANPNECIELVQRRCSLVLMGNHDQAAVALEMAEYFTTHARSAAHWTAGQLTPEHGAYLRGLPYTGERNGVFLVHASPWEPVEWHYILSGYDARKAFKHFAERICFVGHSHIAGVFAETSRARTVGRDDRFIVNVGSVGQPRDGNPRLSFGIFDSERWEYENIRADYDIDGARQKILDAGLPVILAERLVRGM